MRNLFFKLFRDVPLGTSVEISSFNIWHILYLVAIFGCIIGAAVVLKNKSVDVKDKVLKTLAFLLMFSYLTDFFVHDFVYADFDSATGEYVGAGLNMDKLPFHICTVMCPIIVFAQFNKRFQKFLEPIAALAIVAPMMYLTYPSSGVGGEPWCYRVVQTMFFHGVELAWGILTLAYGKVALKWRNIWKAEVLLIGITIWAKLGNEMLGYNWFFLRENPFGITALDKGWLLPILIPTAIFAVTSLVYAINFGIIALVRKLSAKATVSEAAEAIAEEAVLEAAAADAEEK